MRVGVFGGTFDPVHTGHLAAAEEARWRVGLDHILFMPAPRPPHKPDSVVATAFQRLTMVRRAIASNPFFSVSTLEIERPGPSYTVDTLRALMTERPDDAFFYLMGSDSLREIPGWREPEVLCGLVTFVVMVRPGWPREAMAQWLAGQPPACRPRVRFVEMPGLAIASADIRRRLGAGQPCRYLLPEGVRAYVQGRGLYTARRTGEQGEG